MKIAKRQSLQGERLQETVQHAYENVKYYQSMFDERNIDQDNLNDIANISQLPFTTQHDLLDHYPDGMFAVPREDIIRVHASSGTSAKSKIVGYTHDDLQIWSEMVARLYTSGGMDAGDTYQVSLGYGLFTGGFGFHQGAEELGATVIPMSGGNTKRQIQMMQDLESDSIGCITSYAHYIADTAEEMGLDPKSLPISTVFVGGEMTTEAMINRISERLNVDVYNNYGLSEIIGPGVSAQCDHRSDSMHIQSDHFYPEVINPETGNVLDDGKEGELVLTTLTKKALPLFRYRTGDITALHHGSCGCGRTTVRMDHVAGRTDDMITVRGTNVFPSQIETVIYDIDELRSEYRIDVRREKSLDTIEITVEIGSPEDADREKIRKQLTERLKDELQLTPDEVRFVDPMTIERTEVGKVKRLHDHRSLS